MIGVPLPPRFSVRLAHRPCIHGLITGRSVGRNRLRAEVPPSSPARMARQSRSPNTVAGEPPTAYFDSACCGDMSSLRDCFGGDIYIVQASIARREPGRRATDPVDARRRKIRRGLRAYWPGENTPKVKDPCRLRWIPDLPVRSLISRID